MPKGKIITVDEVLAPLFRFLKAKSADARNIVGGMVQKEVARLNALPTGGAKKKSKAATKPTPAPALTGSPSNFDRAAGAKAPKPAAKKSHKKKQPAVQEAPAPRASGENSDA